MKGKGAAGMGALLGAGAGYALAGPAGGMAAKALGGAIGAGLGGNMAKSLTGQDRINVPSAMQKPEWSLSTLDGKLRSDLMLGDYKPQSQGQSQDMLNRQIQMATAQGPSQEAQYLQGANQRNMMNQLGQAEDMGKGQFASMANNMAMRGGLDTGSRERMGKAMNNNVLMNKQKIMNDASGADLNILAQDEGTKRQMMQALPASLLAQAGFERGGKQFDIANTLQTVGGKYGEDMSAWGANQAAREQAQLANKNRGLLGLGFLGL